MGVYYRHTDEMLAYCRGALEEGKLAAAVKSVAWRRSVAFFVLNINGA